MEFREYYGKAMESYTDRAFLLEAEDEEHLVILLVNNITGVIPGVEGWTPGHVWNTLTRIAQGEELEDNWEVCTITKYMGWKLLARVLQGWGIEVFYHNAGWAGAYALGKPSDIERLLDLQPILAIGEGTGKDYHITELGIDLYAFQSYLYWYYTKVTFCGKPVKSAKITWASREEALTWACEYLPTARYLCADVEDRLKETRVREKA